MIFHITSLSQWRDARLLGEYRAESLSKEGFIHCSTATQVLTVANAFFQQQNELILLGIELDKLKAEVKWEPPLHPNPEISVSVQASEKFPHVYGTINLDAVTEIILLQKNEQGIFYLQENLET